MKLSEAPLFPPIRKGFKVSTPLGEGGIAYGRQDLKGWISASVVLNKRTDINYSGTIFRADEIELLEEW